MKRAAGRGWAVAAGVYFFAVFNRSSLGVAGLVAERRFGIGPGALSVFVFLQIGVYAVMQIPTGVLVDRYGPKRLLVCAGSIMAVAQLGFALVDSYPLALIARALLGCGDALTFISVLRYVAGHFSARRYPLLVGLTAVAGTVGNVLATAPLSALLSGAGWPTSFVVAGACTGASAVAVLLLVADSTPAPRPVRRADLAAGVAGVARRVRDAWGVAGTRLGFWVHFSCMSSATTFGVLWGVPYLVQGVGFSSGGASRVLMVAVIVSGLANPTVGMVTGRWPVARIPLSLGSCGVNLAVLLVFVLALGDHPNRGLAAVGFVLVMLGAPASMTAFAVARDYNPPRTLGTASGVVNVGGFLATVLASLLFGLVLDAQGGTSHHSLRLALLVLVGVQGLGTWRLAVWFRRVRAEVRTRQSAGEPVPVRVGRHLWFDIRELEGPAGPVEPA